MSEMSEKTLGRRYVESFGPDGGILLWSRNPVRKLLEENPDINYATDTRDNDAIQLSPREALLLLGYLQLNKAAFERAILEDVLRD